MFWGTPSFFWDKKSTMILFENFKKHPPTPRVLLGLCSIKKVPAPPPGRKLEIYQNIDIVINLF